MNYFMDLSPSKIREHAVSMEMKEGHAKRFFNAISKRKRIAPPLSQQIFTPPVVRDLIGRESGYPLPDKLYSAQSVTAATRRHSTSLRCSVLTNNDLCGGKKKVFQCSTVVQQKGQPDGVPCPYKVIWRAKPAAAFHAAKYEWTLDKSNSILHHKPMCCSGTLTRARMPTRVITCPNVSPRAQRAQRAQTCPHMPKRAPACPNAPPHAQTCPPPPCVQTCPNVCKRFFQDKR